MSYPLADARRMQGQVARWAGRVMAGAVLVGCGGDPTTPDAADGMADVALDGAEDTATDADIAADTASDSAPDATLDGSDGNDADPGDATEDASDAGPELPTWLPTLSSLDDHDALRVPPGDIKFVAWVDGAERVAPLTEACAFQDMHRFEFHLFFLRSLAPWADLTPQGYARLVLFRDTRVFWGGGVRFDPTRVHPTTGVPGALIWTLATDESPGQALTVADLTAADAVLSPCLPAFAEVRAFAPSSDAQRALVAREAAAIAAAGIAVVASP